MFNFAQMTIQQAKQLSPVTLAFVGDAVYTLYVRSALVLSADRRPSELQKLSSLTVSAHGQSELLSKIEERFTNEEREIFLRGRNAKKATKSKNADVAEYNRSTGFEALLGFLYLTGNEERIYQLLKD
ncbi:MAG TPA: Mini-ribonuclease 3 [Candidatus Coproplasma excrementipullorum]|nr:Mini-ribonuclease 3 [Candidatus Coproplasma excrementipullorum]